VVIIIMFFLVNEIHNIIINRISDEKDKVAPNDDIEFHKVIESG